MNYGKIKKILLESDLSNLSSSDRIDLEYSIFKSHSSFDKRLSDRSEFILLYNEMSLDRFAELIKVFNAKVDFDVYSKMEDYRKLLVLELDSNLITFIYNKYRESVDFDTSFYDKISLDKAYSFYRYIDNKRQFFKDLYDKKRDLFVSFLCSRNILEYCSDEMIENIFVNLENFDKKNILDLTSLVFENEEYLNLIIKYNKLDYLVNLLIEENKSIDSKFLDNVDFNKLVYSYRDSRFKVGYLDNEKFRKFIIEKDEFYNCEYNSVKIKNVLDKLDDSEKKICINKLISSYDDMNFDIVNDLKGYLSQDDINNFFDRFKEKFKNLDTAVNIINNNRYNKSDILVRLLNECDIDFYYQIMKNIQYDIPAYCIDELPLERLVFPYKYSYKCDYFAPENVELLRLAVTKELFYSDIDKNSFMKFSKVPEDIAQVFFKNCYKYTNLIQLEFKDSIMSDSKKMIVNYLSDEEIISIIKDMKNDSSFFRVFNILSDDLKNKIYFDGFLEEKFDMTNFITIDNLVDVSTEEMYNDLKKYENFRYTSLPEKYLRNKRTFLLIDIMKNADKVGYIASSGAFPFSLTTEEYNLVPDEYKGIYKDSFKKYDAKGFLELYFSNYSEKSNLAPELREFYHEIFKEKMLCIDAIDFSFSVNYLYFISDRDFEIVFNKLSKQDILLLSLNYKKFSDKLKEVLNEDPDFFNGVKITSIDKYKLKEEYISDELIRNNKYLLKYLDYSQLIVFAKNKYLDGNSELLGIIKKNIISNPNYMQPNIVHYFNDEELAYIFNNMDVICLMKNLFYYKKEYSDLKKIISNRMEEIRNFINDIDDYSKDLSIYEKISLENNCNFIVNLLDGTDLDKFINSVTNFDHVVKYLYRINYKNVELINKFEKRVLELINSYDVDFSRSMYYLPFNDERKIEFLNKINDDKIFDYLLCIIRVDDKKSVNSRFISDYLFKKIQSNKDLLSIPEIYSLFDELYLYLDDQDKNTLNNIIDDEFNKCENAFDDKYFETVSGKCCFIGLSKSRLLNDDTIYILNQLLKNNKHLFSSLDYRILDNDILKLGGYFIEKLSRYPELCSKIVRLKDNDNKRFDIFLDLIKNMDSNMSSSVLDTKFVIMLNYLIKNEVDVKENNSLSDLENYILNSYYNRTIRNIGINGFNEKIDEYVSNGINDSMDIDVVKNLTFIKYFGVDKNVINTFMFSYLSEFDSIKEYCKNKDVLEYIKNLITINDIDSVDVLKKINISKYSINDFLMVRDELKELYVDSIKDDIANYNEGHIVKKNICGMDVDCTDLTYNYGLFIHSTNAYGKMPLLNDNYYDSWNYSSNTRNHGICTCFISNTSYGIPDVKDNGVIFGFLDVNNGDIPLMGPYDLVTKNSGYTIQSIHKPRFSRLQSISDNTRHTHNETSLERRILNENGFTEIRQPNCVVIFEDLPDEIKQNSLKAYEDFKNSGHPIKIIYINRELNMKNQLDLLDNEMDEYLKSYDLDLLKEIINRHNSNRSSTFRANVDVDKSFRLNQVFELLNRTLDYIEKNNDNDYLMKFADILESEDYKYNMLNDILHPERQMIFNAYNKEIRSRINELSARLNQKNM